MRNLGVRLCILCVALRPGSRIPAQEIAGSIRGTVVDPSGAAVSNAPVTAIRAETSLARTVQSDSSGAYVFVELPVGHYRLETEAKGSFNHANPPMAQQRHQLAGLRKDFGGFAGTSGPMSTEILILNDGSLLSRRSQLGDGCAILGSHDRLC
jgi:hypothetical protein